MESNSCVVCGKPIDDRRADAKYCSEKCRQAANYRERARVKKLTDFINETSELIAQRDTDKRIVRTLETVRDMISETLPKRKGKR